MFAIAAIILIIILFKVSSNFTDNKYTECFLVSIYQPENAVEFCKNILKYSKKSFVVIHNNCENFTNEELTRKLKDNGCDERIFINPERLEMKTGHHPSPNSLWEVYMSCIKYALTIPDWKYAVFMQSNERFVRTGVDEYFEKTDYDGGFSEIPEHPSGKFRGNKFIKDSDYETYKKYMPQFDKLYYGQTEGSFVSRNIAEIMSKIPSMDYSKTSKLQAPHERFIPSFMYNYSDKIGNSITHVRWSENMEVKQEDIVAMRNDAMPGMYCVKRVNMDDTTIREYINNLSS